MAVEQEDDAGGIPEWVVTFGDMMSLLLTFFIMLVSLSEIKQEEIFQAMVESIQRKFGYEDARSLSPGKFTPRTKKRKKRRKSASSKGESERPADSGRPASGSPS